MLKELIQLEEALELVLLVLPELQQLEPALHPQHNAMLAVPDLGISLQEVVRLVEPERIQRVEIPELAQIVQLDQPELQREELLLMFVQCVRRGMEFKEDIVKHAQQEVIQMEEME